MIGYDTYKPPKLKECISKIIITEDTPRWIIEAYLKYDVHPTSFKVNKYWEKTI
jgi:hypothetical protein